MLEEARSEGQPGAPLWIRRPATLHQVAYALAGLVFAGQLVAVLVTGAGPRTVLAVLVAGAGVALSWRLPWVGLVVTSGASFAVIEVGRDPLSVWMMAVLVLFSFALRGRQAVLGTAVVAACFLGAFMTVGGFRGGAFGGAAALFSAVAGGATGAALRIYRRHWWTLVGVAETALATREVEATRRVIEERVRIARDLHDVIGHQVAMLSVHLGVAEIGLPTDASSSREAIVAARASGRTVVVETQRILALLRRRDEISDEEALRPTPGLSALDGLITSFEGIGLEVHATLSLPDSLESLDSTDPGVGLTVYRVVQESLTNAYRHGEGAATVEVRAVGDRICVTVENLVGHGAPPPRVTTSGGLGLVGIRERVESVGGVLTIQRSDRFVVRVELSLAGAVAP